MRYICKINKNACHNDFNLLILFMIVNNNITILHTCVNSIIILFAIFAVIFHSYLIFPFIAFSVLYSLMDWPLSRTLLSFHAYSIRSFNISFQSAYMLIRFIHIDISFTFYSHLIYTFSYIYYFCNKIVTYETNKKQIRSIFNDFDITFSLLFK